MLRNNAFNNEGELIHFALLDVVEPINHDEGIKSKVWREAKMEELKPIDKNHTWEMVNLLYRKKTIDVKWIFKVKMNLDGKVSRYKVSLTATCFVQKYDIA